MIFIEEPIEGTTLDQEEATEHRRWDCFTAIAWNLLLVQHDFMPKWGCSCASTSSWWSANVGSALKAWAQRFVICFSPLVLTAPLFYWLQGLPRVVSTTSKLQIWQVAYSRAWSSTTERSVPEQFLVLCLSETKESQATVLSSFYWN